MTDVPRPPDPPIEVPFDPEDEREVEPVESGLPDQLGDAGIEAPEADTLDQLLDVPLDDDDR